MSSWDARRCGVQFETVPEVNNSYSTTKWPWGTHIGSNTKSAGKEKVRDFLRKSKRLDLEKLQAGTEDVSKLAPSRRVSKEMEERSFLER